jgi:hypothetical protein
MSEQKTPDYSFINSQIDSTIESQNLNFVSIGNLIIKSGKFVACDPYCYPEEKPFDKTFAPGVYPVITVNDGGQESCIFVRFKDTVAVRWENATRVGEKLEDLKEGECFSYGVDAGTGSFMDADAAKILCSYEESGRVMPWNGTHPFFSYYIKNYYHELKGENFASPQQIEIAEKLQNLIGVSEINSFEQWLERFIKQERENDRSDIDSDTEKLTLEIQNKTKANEDIVLRLVILMLETEATQLRHKAFRNRQRAEYQSEDKSMPPKEKKDNSPVIPDPIKWLENAAKENPEKHKQLVDLWEKEIKTNEEQLDLSIDKAGWRGKVDPITYEDAKRLSRYKNVVLDARNGLNFIACSSGWGDGNYPSFYGYDDSGDVCIVITDFMGIGLPYEDDEEDE